MLWDNGSDFLKSLLNVKVSPEIEAKLQRERRAYNFRFYLILGAIILVPLLVAAGVGALVTYLVMR